MKYSCFAIILYCKLLGTLFKTRLVSGARQGQTPDMLSCGYFRVKASFVPPSRIGR